MVDIRPNDRDVFDKIGHIIIDSLADVIKSYGMDVPPRNFVGFETPPEDCCPDLVVWLTNIRLWDEQFADGRSTTYITNCVNAWAVDVNVRLGRCYIDFDANGQPLDAGTLEEWSKLLNKDAHALSIGWIQAFRQGQIKGLGSCDLVDMGTLTSYRQADCAGWQVTYTVGIM